MTKEQILNHVNFDINKAKAIYEWLNVDETVKESTIANYEAIIEACYSEKCDGIRVQALGEDFIISLHDLNSRDSNLKYDEAMVWLRKRNMTTFNKKQAAIISIYFDQINNKLIEVGGDPFADDWYTTNELYIPKNKCSLVDYDATDIWYFSCILRCIYICNRCSINLRCRPCINLRVSD